MQGDDLETLLAEFDLGEAGKSMRVAFLGRLAAFFRGACMIVEIMR